MPTAGIENSLKERGVRLTRQRRILLDLLDHSGRHLNAESLYQMAIEKDPKLNRVTVYRTLGLLKKHGLIDELDLLHMRGEGHYYEQRPLRQHLHLGCLECGLVTEFESPYFEKMKAHITREIDFAVSFARVEIGGYCVNCQRKRPGSGKR